MAKAGNSSHGTTTSSGRGSATEAAEEGSTGEIAATGGMETGWESVPDALEAFAGMDHFRETGDRTTETDDGHLPVSSDETPDEMSADVDDPFVGDEATDEDRAAVPDRDLEAVPGYDTGQLMATRESLADLTSEDNLLDAWYADIGDPTIGAMLRRPGAFEEVAEVVIGPDDRLRITNTTAFPWRSICSLRITAEDGSRWIGTGWLVGHRTLITAGHCVFIHSRGGWADSVEVIPGRNGSSRPFGSCVATTLHSTTGWTRDAKRSHDYAAIVLPEDCDYGRRLGYFGYANYARSTLRDMRINLSGYPGDKPTGTQWWHARAIRSVTSKTLVYNIDTAGGQSGSPVWRLKNGRRYAVGIHTNGASSGNSATRITKPVFANIRKWKSLGM